MKYLYTLFTWIWLLFAKEKEVRKVEVKKPFLLSVGCLQTFAGDPGGAGGSGADPGGAAGAGAEGGTGEEAFATFKTQEDLNKRLSRAEKKGQKELATSLGFESVEAMQEALKTKEPPATKTGQGKEKDPDPVNVDAVVEAKLKEERDKTFKRLVNAEVKVLANELGFADWEDALALAELTEVKEDDKGNIVGVKEALEALSKKKPHLLKQSKNGQFGAPIPNNQQRQKESLENIKKMATNRGTQQTAANNPWA
ncbi:scaffolding protein [Cytobacillus sp. FSL W8-0315]|uniref:scaffolding protein n=1 Tax=Cytobacillus sp. FSL W8-0315 TaxID=2921600 RepID=UPI0030F997B0